MSISVENLIGYTFIPGDLFTSCGNEEELVIVDSGRYLCTLCWTGSKWTLKPNTSSKYQPFALEAMRQYPFGPDGTKQKAMVDY